jgi:hypothetical protein
MPFDCAQGDNATQLFLYQTDIENTNNRIQVISLVMAIAISKYNHSGASTQAGIEKR